MAERALSCQERQRAGVDGNFLDMRCNPAMLRKQSKSKKRVTFCEDVIEHEACEYRSFLQFKFF